MRIANYSRFSDGSMFVDRIFDFGCAQTVTRYVNHIVHTACDAVIAVGVPFCAVARKVFAGEGGEIGLDEAFMVPINRTHLPRPAVEHDEISFGLAFQDIAIIIDKGGLSAEKRFLRRAGF